MKSDIKPQGPQEPEAMISFEHMSGMTKNHQNKPYR